MSEKKWVTVLTHRGYQIKVLNRAAFDQDYMIDDPFFLPDYRRFKTVEEAVEAIDKETK